MDFHFVRSINRLVQKPGYPTVLKDAQMKRGDGLPLRVFFYPDLTTTTPEVLAGGLNMTFGFKAGFAEADPLLAAAVDWELVPGDAPYYTCPLGLNSEGLETALGDDDSKTFFAELTYTLDGGLPVSSQTIALSIQNDVIKGNEGAPSQLPTEEGWLTARALRHDISQNLDSSHRDQALDNLGLTGDADAGFKIILTPAGHPWIWMRDIATGNFLPVALDSAGGAPTPVVLDPAAAPFV